MGEAFALASAVLWALAVILFRRAGVSVPALGMNLFRVVVSSACFLLTLVLLGEPLLRPAAARDVLLLVASGVIAIAISDTFFHLCLNRVGAGINAVVDTLYAPFTALFAFALLGERLDWSQLTGMAFIVAGVVVASRAQPPPGTTGRTLVAGILYGVASMATLGLGIVIAKPALVRHDVLWATTVRQLGSLLVLAPVAALLPGRRLYWGAFRPQPAWRASLPGTLLGSYLALTCWIAGMKHTQTGTAAALNQTTTIFILVFAALLLRERFGRRKVAAALLALAGIVFVVVPADFFAFF